MGGTTDHESHKQECTPVQAAATTGVCTACYGTSLHKLLGVLLLSFQGYQPLGYRLGSDALPIRALASIYVEH